MDNLGGVMEKQTEEIIIDDVRYINPKGFDEVIPTGQQSLSVESPVQGKDIMYEVREEMAQVMQTQIEQIEQIESEFARSLLLGGDLNVTTEK